ncbi:MAG: hypothetical protein ACN6OS_22635, partial [Comamonas testosteroni]
MDEPLSLHILAISATKILCADLYGHGLALDLEESVCAGRAGLHHAPLVAALQLAAAWKWI